IKVDVYEALHEPGGVLIYGIPAFRLPKDVVATELDGLRRAGVDFKVNWVGGRTVTVDDLFAQGYKAVFIGVGAGLPMFLGIPGENLVGVFSANEYLTRINLMKAYRPEYVTPIRQSHGVAVVGGGNVAMDAARCAKRMGAEVTIIYRRSLDEMPARREEVHHAMEEGIVFRVLASPTAVVGDEAGQVSAIRCTEMELGEPDASGRRRPVEKAGSEFTLAVDTVIIAIGTSPNPLLRSTTAGLETNRHGCIVADDAMQTSRECVYAGGDAVTGAATVILAMGAGKTAAQSIDRQLQERK
ncbi:MAG: FAD-dependent oxidoreductase, partial [Angelakisella sp.]